MKQNQNDYFFLTVRALLKIFVLLEFVVGPGWVLAGRSDPRSLSLIGGVGMASCLLVLICLGSRVEIRKQKFLEASAPAWVGG